MNKPPSDEEIKKVVCAFLPSSYREDAHRTQGCKIMRDQWAKSNGEIVERLEEIGKDTTDMRTCVLIDELIKELNQ